MYVRRRIDIALLRLRSLFRRARVDTELDKELSFHFDQQVKENLARGMPPDKARLAALRSFGGFIQIQEDCRDMRRTQYFENFLADLRYTIRALGRTPGFAAVIVLTMALAIGANTAIFSVIDGVLLRPLPYPRADRISRIFLKNANYPKFPLNPFDFRDIRAQNRSFHAVAAMTRADVQLSGDFEPVKLNAFRITAGYFRVLGLKPARGREFTTNDELPGNGRLAILSDRLWRKQFAADPNILDRKITLDSQPFTVIGVMPPGVQHPGNDYHALADGDTVDLWYPFTFEGNPNNRGSHFIEGVGRLRDGITPARAAAELDSIMAELGRVHPGSVGWRVLVNPLYDEMVGSARRMLLVLLGAVALVLLIACVNAANLLLARATSRQREIAVRAAIGAGRSRIVRQMLAESLLISVVGGACGAVLAIGGVRALVFLLPAGFPRSSSIHLDAAVFGFTLAIALATGILFGLMPALHASRTDLQQALREGGRGASESRGQLGLRNLLVVGEVALACVLLAGAGLMLRSFVNLLRTDPGFQPRHVLTAALSLPNERYKTAPDVTRFYTQLTADLAAAPGVQAAGIGTDLPWTGYNENIGGWTIEGHKSLPGQENHARYHIASPDYFKAIGVPLLRGRFYTDHDDKDSPRVLIINQALAQRYFPNEDALGRRIDFFDDQPKEKDWFRIVGIVGDVKDRPNSSSAEPAFWWSMRQLPWPETNMSVAVRSSSDPAFLVNQLRLSVRRLDPTLALGDVRVMDQIADAGVATPRFALFLVALFAALALALAAIGIYGVISYSVNQRMPEFGMRMALGAKPWDVIQLVLKQAVRLSLVGTALGIVCALAFTRLLGSLLYQVSGTDPLTFAIVAVTAVATATLACYLPARRATNADPMQSLRAE